MKTFFLFLLLPAILLAKGNPLLPAGVTAKEEQRLSTLEKTLQLGYNTPAQLKAGVMISGDVLYWTAHETGLPYALEVNTPLPSLFSSRTDVVREPQFDWDFGFRLAAGIDFHRDGWDLGTSWTRLWTQAKDRGQADKNRGWIPIWSDPNFVTSDETASEAEANWDLHYDQLDLFLGRSFYVSRYCILRPFLGPSALWINQHYDLEYKKTSKIVEKNRVNMKGLFSGIGLNLGGDIRFCFHYGWSLFGKGNIGLYSGSFKITRKGTLSEEKQTIQELKSHNHLHLGSPIAQIGVGIRWDHLFSKNRYSMTVKLLWEQGIFFSQNQLFRFVTPNENQGQSSFVSNQGDLTLQGGTFSAAFNF